MFKYIPLQEKWELLREGVCGAKCPAFEKQEDKCWCKQYERELYYLCENKSEHRSIFACCKECKLEPSNQITINLVSLNLPPI